MKERIAAAYRYSRAIWIGLAIALAVLLVSSVSVDLGPALKARAERAGSNWLDRPMHIGRLGVQNGDMLRSMNGFEMNDADAMLNALGNLRSQSALSLSVMRRGAPVTIDYSVR